MNPNQFVVLSLPRPEGERFAIFRDGDWLRVRPAAESASCESRLELMERFARALELFPEDEMRTRLGTMGLAAGQVDEHIERARRIAQARSRTGCARSARTNDEGVQWGSTGSRGAEGVVQEVL